MIFRSLGEGPFDLDQRGAIKRDPARQRRPQDAPA
jgi:hypothetical protein